MEQVILPFYGKIFLSSQFLIAKYYFLGLYVIHNIDNNQVKYLVGIGEHAYRYLTSVGQITLQTLLTRITTDTFHSS